MLNFIKGLFGTNPETSFWDWFLKEKNRIEEFIDNDNDDYAAFQELTLKVNKFNSELFPELTKSNGKYVLIITPDGIKDGIEATIKLVDSAPSVDKWIVKKFRQPKDEIKLNYNGLEYPSSDIEVIPELDFDENKVDIIVFIRNMKKDVSNYQTLAFLYFDHILGEYNTMTKVGGIKFSHLNDQEQINNSISILELRKLIEDKLN